eukprot:NODE_44_length_33449_cov_1.575742.p22 type:complete len:229 gc:universal NODE_44_length_33449_cov_1.575742:515-1201(+)
MTLNSVNDVLRGKMDEEVIIYIKEMINLGDATDLESFLGEYDCLDLKDSLINLIPKQISVAQVQKLDKAVELHSFKGNTLKDKRKDISSLRDNVTIVDQEELVKAEKKLLEKRERKKDRLRVKEIHLSSLDKRVTLTDEEVFKQYVAQKQAKNMDIDLEHLTLNLYGLTVLKDADLKLSYRRRYGLIGMNGIGKVIMIYLVYSSTRYHDSRSTCPISSKDYICRTGIA